MVEPEGTAQSDLTANLLRAAAVVALLFVFLMGVRGLGDGFYVTRQRPAGFLFQSDVQPIRWIDGRAIGYDVNAELVGDDLDDRRPSLLLPRIPSR